MFMNDFNVTWGIKVEVLVGWRDLKIILKFGKLREVKILGLHIWLQLELKSFIFSGFDDGDERFFLWIECFSFYLQFIVITKSHVGVDAVLASVKDSCLKAKHRFKNLRLKPELGMV